MDRSVDGRKSVKKVAGGKFKTLTVTYSWPVAQPDGTTALLLRTVEDGIVAFRLNRTAIDLIRSQLTNCDTVRSRQAATRQ